MEIYLRLVQNNGCAWTGASFWVVARVLTAYSLNLYDREWTDVSGEGLDQMKGQKNTEFHLARIY